LAGPRRVRSHFRRAGVRTLRLFAYNRPALVSFRDRDHGDDKSAGLREYVQSNLGRAGIDIGSGAVRLLCMPRIAGYGFNPLSIFFCHGQDGGLRAIIWEVNNTFGERHSYLIEVESGSNDVVKQHCAKRFFVSPFLDQDLTYDFRVSGPGDDVSVVIRASNSEGPLLLAALSGRARDFTDANLFGLLLQQPFLTLKVIAAIHWEAVRLWIKRVGIRRKPPKPAYPITTVRSCADASGGAMTSESKRSSRVQFHTT
jgi:DUF1365 family protein